MNPLEKNHLIFKLENALDWVVVRRVHVFPLFKHSLGR